MRQGIALATTLALLFAGCTNEKKVTAPLAPSKTKPNFRQPTAEEAYRLQDDCTRRGEGILAKHFVGSALTHDQVSRYNETTNRCYVRLEVRAKFLDELAKHDNSTYLYDGQTGELLAFLTVKADQTNSFLGFGCGEFPCVSEKIAACMSGKDCEPE